MKSGPSARSTAEQTAATRLDNGLTVVTERMPDVRSVSVGFWVGTGSVDEEPVLAGASHFLEHLLFKGTAGRSARSIAEAIDAVGGDINAFTTKEYTAFYVRLLAESLDLGLDILSDIIWSPAFRPDEIEAERQVILEEILMHGDDPADLVHDVFAAGLFPDHPLGREVLGEEATIRSMTGAQIAGFHGEHYLPGNIVVAAAGNLDHGAVVAGISRRLSDRAGGRPPFRESPPGPGLARVAEDRPTEQAHVVVGVRAPDRADDDRFALSVIDHVLGGGMSSRLFQSIREERGLVYSVYSYRTAFEKAGAFAVYAGTSPSRATEVLDLVHAELDRMSEQGVTGAELTAARSHLRGATALGLEDSGARMNRIGRSQLIHGRVPSIDEIDSRLSALTPDEVGEVAHRVFSGARTVAVVGSPDGESRSEVSSDGGAPDD